MKRFWAAAALVGMASGTWAAPAVPNGSFESYGVDYGSSELLNSLQGPTYPFIGGWSANGTATSIVDAGASLLPAGNGTQYVTFSSSTQEIYQNIGGFVAGQSYRVSYWATGGPGYWWIQESNTDGAIAADGTWKQYSFTFSATGYDQHLWFGSTGSSALSLDNITVSAVPEPETYALMLLGLGAVGFAGRRRKSR